LAAAAIDIPPFSGTQEGVNTVDPLVFGWKPMAQGISPFSA